MPRVAENSDVKKEMTKLKNCTKKYRKAVRAYYKTSVEFNKIFSGAPGKKRDKLSHKLIDKSTKANNKADKIKTECESYSKRLEMMMNNNKVVKPENREKIRILIDNFDKDEIEWSSNTSSDLSAMNIN